MQEESKNKMVGGSEDKNLKNKYFYPAYQITIEASSKEEADKMLDKKIKATK